MEIFANINGIDGDEVVVLKQMKPPLVGLGIFIGKSDDYPTAFDNGIDFLDKLAQ